MYATRLALAVFMGIPRGAGAPEDDSHLYDTSFESARCGRLGEQVAAPGRSRRAAGGVEDFYRKRNLLQRSVFPEDVAEGIYFFPSEASGKSTGNILNVDAGNAVAFTRWTPAG